MDADREIENGVANCAIILTAKKMGYDVAYVELAMKSIKNGGGMDPIMIGHFSKESTRVHNLIAKDNRYNEANKIAVCILEEYGY